jgi:hypothetical protein
VDAPNPRIASPPPPPFTTTGGQRDDDADGFGNACDAQVVSTGAVTTAADFNAMKASLSKPRAASTCGVARDIPCPRFDLDGVGAAISVPDFNAVKRALGRPSGPRCTACGNFALLPCSGLACPTAEGGD